jgi:RHS repeat-associated protein
VISQVEDHIDYTSYGTETQSASSLGGIIGYDGYVSYAYTGLDFNVWRVYNPSTGRWLTQDPIGFQGGQANLYEAVGNDPTNATDPSGLTAVLAGPGDAFFESPVLINGNPDPGMILPDLPNPECGADQPPPPAAAPSSPPKQSGVLPPVVYGPSGGITITIDGPHLVGQPIDLVPKANQDDAKFTTLRIGAGLTLANLTGYFEGKAVKWIQSPPPGTQTLGPPIWKFTADMVIPVPIPVRNAQGQLVGVIIVFVQVKITVQVKVGISVPIPLPTAKK